MFFIYYLIKNNEYRFFSHRIRNGRFNLCHKSAEKFPDKKIVIITKGSETDSNTNYAQGGVAIVNHATDSFESHVKDTLKAGDGLCDESVVRMVVGEGPNCLSKW